MAILFSRGRFFIFWLFYTYAEAQCYFPGGALASQQSPCDPYAYTTLCCPFGWTCFSNNLCIVTDLGAVNGDFPIGTAIRGTCTNPLWNNSECGDFCLNDPISANNGSVQACGDGNEGNWCCTPAVEDGTCDCQSGKGTFSIEQGIAQTIIGVFGLESTSTIPPHPSTSSASVSSKTPSSSISSTSIASSTSSRTSSSSKSSTQTQSSTQSSTHVTSSTSSTTSTTQSSTHATSSTTSHSITAGSAQSTASSAPVSITRKVGFKAGISVAAIVVVLALFGVAGFFWWRRWKRKRALETPPRDDDSETFQMRERAPTPHIIRLNPDPYQFTPSPGTPAPRMGNRNEMWNRDHGRLSPPVNNPYSIPYEGLKPGIRPYEGT